jgi:ribose-phosphate pyrophosphokinase
MAGRFGRVQWAENLGIFAWHPSCIAVAGQFRVFAGIANDELADLLTRGLGVRLGASEVSRFPDGEVSVEILEPIQERPVFIVQSTSPPVNDHLVELLAFVDACPRAGARRITAVIPYFGYGRADKRHGRHEPISASMVADLLQCVGVNHVVTVDLHAAQSEGFFRVPVDNLTAVSTLCGAVRDRLPSSTVVVTPDPGRLRMAIEYAERLGLPVAVLHTGSPTSPEADAVRVVGDVRGHPCLIVDDIIATGTTLARSIEALQKAGARPGFIIAATHGLLLSGARERLGDERVSEVFVTDTVRVDGKGCPKLRVVSVAPLIVAALQRLLAEGSLTDAGPGSA